jgi:uncharacterized protein YgbK (DUF1537 family)
VTQQFRAALIADDLTGNNNAGVLVAKQGLATISVGHTRPVFPDDCEVACIDTDSRYVAAQEARKRVREMSAWARGQGASILCNRVDNLLRGNIGAEVAGMMDHLGAEAVAIVAPAFPVLGRLIEGGRLLVNGEPVHKNPVAANDPFSPVRYSDIDAILGEQMDAPVAQIGGDTLKAGSGPVVDAIEKAAAQGARAIVVDQADDADVATLADAMARLDRAVFPVDPGPLSALYLKAMRQRGSADDRGRKVLAAIGSITPVTREQVGHLAKARSLEPLCLDPGALIDDEGARAQAIDAVVEAAIRQTASDDVVLLTTLPPGAEPLDVATLAAERGITAHQLSLRISDALAQAIVQIVEGCDGAIGGCFSSGGDVTASLFEATGAEAVRVLGDVIPLTAHVSFMGGRLDGLQLVTKGGSIGDSDAMELCLAHLQKALGCVRVTR